MLSAEVREGFGKKKVGFRRLSRGYLGVFKKEAERSLEEEPGILC